MAEAWDRKIKFSFAKFEVHVRQRSRDAKYRVESTTSVKGRGEGWVRHKNRESITLEVIVKRVGVPETT